MTDRYQIQSKPTVYSGVKFRSRLEAQWAHLFDQVEIPWEYEPVLRDGWLPDFRLWGRFLVEVKPIPPSGFAMARGDFDLIGKAISDEWAILLGDGPGDNFGALVRTDHGLAASMTFMFDPMEPFKMRSIAGDGGGDHCRGRLDLNWKIAVAAFRKNPSPSERISMAHSATSKRGRRAFRL